MNRTLLLPFAASLVVGALGLAGCGSGNSNSTPTAAVSTTTKSSPATSPTSAVKTGTAAASSTAPTLTSPTTTPDGLKYQDTTVGTGAVAVAGKRVTVNYTLWLPGGKLIQSSKQSGQPFQFVLGQGNVIKGWDEGVAGMKVGGTRLLYLPTALAYGARSPSPDIPVNSDLVFEVDLLAVQ